MSRHNPIDRRELLKSMLRGPATLSGHDAANYRLWFTTWILPQLAELKDPKLVTAIEASGLTFATLEDQSGKVP
jgi:hypothetical protein